MAVLSDAQRREVWADIMNLVDKSGESIAIDKIALRQAINSSDQWIDDNAAAFNASLPEEARTALAASQKSRIFEMVAAKRREVG